MDSGHIAKSVVITNEYGQTTYRVVGVVNSGSRGREFQLANGDNLHARHCHAPMWKTVVKATTSGETIDYIW
jgi:hypothetical protein